MRELVCLLADVERGDEGNGMRDVKRCGAGGETPIASDPGGGMKRGDFVRRKCTIDREKRQPHDATAPHTKRWPLPHPHATF